jgi:hypothetical protein
MQPNKEERDAIRCLSVNEAYSWEVFTAYLAKCAEQAVKEAVFAFADSSLQNQHLGANRVYADLSHIHKRVINE